MKKLSFFIAGTGLLTAFDQLTKVLAIRYLKDMPGITLVPGIFELCYVENFGSAWGMFRNLQWLSLLFTVLMVAAVIYGYIKVPQTKHYRTFRVLAAVLAAGALGNAIDRLTRGFVVDFFYFSLIDFPVFNVADCFICVSLVLLLIIYRNEDFAWMKKS